MTAVSGLTIDIGFPAAERAGIAALLREYETSLGISLGFQGFEAEVATLPGDYAPPRGAFATARLDGRIVGMIALRPLEGSAAVCEMKRLYVSPAARGSGAGRSLALAIIAEAERLGYRRMVLDTLPAMREAQALYRKLGFREVDAYYANPVAGTLYMERVLRPDADPS